MFITIFLLIKPFYRLREHGYTFSAAKCPPGFRFCTLSYTKGLMIFVMRELLVQANYADEN